MKGAETNELKNCPRCGGTLNDNGRCEYCGSKVYDLTDIDIDLDSHDILRMRLKTGNGEFVANCFLENLSITRYPIYETFVDVNGFKRSNFLKDHSEIQLTLISS